ncbi:nuclear transport factor 2 family protein [Nocardioides luteus]|uniref:nuclear transport factor 2 family protein n=1 Tax=Nocardioides luteus TaxID=1844 RepID=UPI0018CB97BF|nr:nuclear transport factor 2 family protein [Nocardioides luteus]MBG6096428.1 hypothetical protein [Nocardioides luteus]
MPDLKRAEIEAFWAEWLSLNRQAEAEGDWAPLADVYAEDATYGWMYTPDEHFMAVGRDQIREWALGTEMAGLEGWHYDYQATVIDDVNAMVIGFWRQRAGIVDDATGEEYEILGIGGSWFGVAPRPDGNGLEFAWQRDWFDLVSTATTFLDIVKAKKATAGLLERMSLNGIEQPGHYRLADLPSTVWPPPVAAGNFVTQETV